MLAFWLGVVVAVVVVFVAADVAVVAADVAVVDAVDDVDMNTAFVLDTWSCV